MDDGLPLDAGGMASGDPGAGLALEQGAQTTKSKELPHIKGDEDFTALPHGSRFFDPSGQMRYKPIRKGEEGNQDYLALEEGAEFVDPEGNFRTKPFYQGVDFSAQALYDIAHSDKGRKMALEKFYPGKVREDPSGGFYIEDDGGKLRKPGRGLSAATGFAASEAIPGALGAIGSVIGGGVGTMAEPVGGTAVGGAAGAYGGGYMGQRINDIFSQLAGVYDPEGGEANARMAGIASAAGDVGGRALFAAVPTIKEGARAIGKGASKTASKFLGTNAESLETALPIAEAGEKPGGPFGLSKPGTAVSPSAIFESSPHLTNVAEILQQKFDKSDTYIANAERFMDKRAKEILASKDIGSLVEGSLTHPTAAVPTEKAGILLKESAQAKAVQQSAEADARLQAELANRRAAVEAKHAPDIETHRARNSQVIQTAEQAKSAADNLVQEGFQAINKQADDALKVAKAGYNSGDLWRTVAKSFVDLRASIQSRATKMYGDAETAAGGLVPPGSNGLAQPAQQLIAELPEGFESLHPSIVRKLRDIAGVKDEATGEWIKEPADATWVQLHNLRSQIRQDIKWNDLTSDIRNGTLKLLDKKINEVLHPVEEGTVETAAKAAPRSFDEFKNAAPTPATAARNAQHDSIVKEIDPLIADLNKRFPALGKQLQDIRNQLGAANDNVDAEAVWDRLDQALEFIEKNTGGSELTRRLSKMLEDVGAVHDEPYLQHMNRQYQLDTAYNKVYKETLEGLTNPKADWLKHTSAKQMLESLERPYEFKSADPLFDYAEKSAFEEAAKVLRSRAGGGNGIKEASRLLKLADGFYRENMGPLNQQQLKALVKALDVGGIQADPKALLKIAIRDGQTEVAESIKKTVGPQTWDALRAADVLEKMAQSRLLDGSIDGAKFARLIEDMAQNGVLDVLHGERGGARLRQQALYIQQLRGKLPISARPGDTANDIILRARSAAADAENLAKTDPLKALSNEMKKVEAATRREFKANQKPDPLAFLTNSTVGANAAVDKLLGDPDLIVAASRAFPGGEKSPEFQLMRQIWTERFLRETMDPGEKMAATSPEIQALMFPGVTLEDMHMLVKEMKLLMSGATMRGGGGDMGGSIMAQSAVENPLGRASGLGKLAGPAKVLPGVNFGARAALTAYYNMVRGLLTSPSTLRWLRKGLQSRDPAARENARAELQAALQKGGAMGSATGSSLHQYSQQPDQGVME